MRMERGCWARTVRSTAVWCRSHVGNVCDRISFWNTFVASLCVVLCVHGSNKLFTQQLSHVHVHDTSTTRRMWIDFLLICVIFLQTSQLGVLSCHVHLLYEKELHKSLSRQVVYSFYEICNGCVALVKLVSFVGIYVYIRSVYITYIFLLFTEPSGHLENSIPLYNQYLGNGFIFATRVERACLVLTAFSMHWMVVCTWIGDDVLFAIGLEMCLVLLCLSCRPWDSRLCNSRKGHLIRNGFRHPLTLCFVTFTLGCVCLAQQ